MVSKRSAILVLTALTALLTACSPMQKAWFWQQVESAPQPVSEQRCPSGPVKDEIQQVFVFAAPWAESIAWRESNCEPGARNPSGSAGLFQLLGHDDLLLAACPDVPPGQSWAVADCNIRAAKNLYDGSGVTPWRL